MQVDDDARVLELRRGHSRVRSVQRYTRNEIPHERRLKMSKKLKDFEELSDSEKRVRIANDVLIQLDKGKIKARQGSYFDLKIPTEEFRDERDLQDLLKSRKKTIKPCTACAMGALFTCHVMETDNFKLGQTRDDCFSPRQPVNTISVARYQMDERLTEFFELGQLRLIECAFEMSTTFYTDDFWGEPGDEAARAKEFGERYRWPKQRLRAIMKNIIKNNGKFIP